jgi:hypothetical protein
LETYFSTLSVQALQRDNSDQIVSAGYAAADRHQGENLHNAEKQCPREKELLAVFFKLGLVTEARMK